MKLKEYWNILMNTTFLSYLNINLHKIKLILFRNEIFEYRIVCFLLKYGNHQKMFFYMFNRLFCLPKTIQS